MEKVLWEKTKFTLIISTLQNELIFDYQLKIPLCAQKKKKSKKKSLPIVTLSKHVNQKDGWLYKERKF